MKRQILVFIGIICLNVSFAQNEVDALRYSFLNYSGTARFAGVGGAMGAIGGDLGAVNINPATMAKFSRSKISLTPNVTYTGFNSNYNDNKSKDGRLNLNFSNIGLVLSSPIRDGSLWRTFQIGFTYTRTNDFQSNERVEGIHNNSLLDEFSALATGRTTQDLLDSPGFAEGLAYSTYLIEYDAGNDEYYPWYTGSEIQQIQTIKSRGSQSARDITVSGNYGDKILVGGSIGFPSIRYEEEKSYTENFTDNQGVNNDTLNSYTYNTNLTTRGNGFNAKIGVVVIPHPVVRFGLSVHTPTWYSLDDKYDASILSEFSNGDSFEALSPEGLYEYRLKTPARYTGSLGLIIGKRAFVSADYEYVDYSAAKLKSDDYSFSAENTITKNNYKAVGNLRVGGEFRVTNNYTVRAGFSQYGSPVNKTASDLDQKRTNYSFGAGYKDREFSIDVSYVLSKWSNEQYLYAPSLTSPVTRNYALNNFMVTAGFRF